MARHSQSGSWCCHGSPHVWHDGHGTRQSREKTRAATPGAHQGPKAGKGMGAGAGRGRGRGSCRFAKFLSRCNHKDALCSPGLHKEPQRKGRPGPHYLTLGLGVRGIDILRRLDYRRRNTNAAEDSRVVKAKVQWSQPPPANTQLRTVSPSQGQSPLQPVLAPAETQPRKERENRNPTQKAKITSGGETKP